MNIRQHIPNLFTLGNLVCGSIAIVHISQTYDVTLSVFLIFLAGFFDLLDGAVARVLKVSGELGKQLDSLADVVSFGLAPSIIIYKMLEQTLSYDLQWLKYLAFLNVACAALRLAKFNISTDQNTDFSGMPSPANGIFWASLLAIPAWGNSGSNDGFIQNIYPLAFIFTMLLVTSLLMVSSIRMFSFKFNPGGYKANLIPSIFIVLVIVISTVSLIEFRNVLLCIPNAIILYILMSLIYHRRLTK